MIIPTNRFIVKLKQKEGQLHARRSFRREKSMVENQAKRRAIPADDSRHDHLYLLHLSAHVWHRHRVQEF